MSGHTDQISRLALRCIWEFFTVRCTSAPNPGPKPETLTPLSPEVHGDVKPQNVLISLGQACRGVPCGWGGGLGGLRV